jgi:hypothetical protein
MTLASLLVAALVGTAPTSPSRESVANSSPPVYSAYESSAANFMYDLLFCDRRDSFRGAAEGEQPPPGRSVLFSEPPDISGLKRLAGDVSADGRIRYLAFARLRDAGVPVEPKVLLGVIIEVGLSDGLDTLAAFSDGGVRYINHSGKMIVVEGTNKFSPLVNRLFQSASLVVARIGPWDQPRRPPPGKGNLRLTFLVSDGLYFGEGRLDAFDRDALAGPVFRDGSELMLKVVAFVKKD